MKGQAVERISIRWLPDPAFEDTRTVALNVGGYFIDLRTTKEEPSIQWSHAGELTILKEEPCKFLFLLKSRTSLTQYLSYVSMDTHHRLARFH